MFCGIKRVEAYPQVNYILIMFCGIKRVEAYPQVNYVYMWQQLKYMGIN